DESDVVVARELALEPAGERERPGHPQAALDSAAGGALQAREDLNQRRLAGAVAAENRHPLAFTNAEGHSVENASRAHLGVKFFDNVDRLDLATRQREGI